MYVCAAAISLAALILYHVTALPGPGWVDSGELASVSHSLGIPHPTGSPLYVLLSRLFSLVSPGNFWPLTLLSSLAAALAVGLVTLAVPVWEGAWGVVIVCATGMLMALSPSLWSQGTINEVYALQALLLACFLFLRTRGSARSRALSAFVAGLAFANHQSAIFLSPYLISDVWRGRRSPSTWYTVFGLGLLGSSLYLYLPIRSAQSPLLDWGGTHRWAAFVRHITGWQYKSWVGLSSVKELRDALGFAGGHVARNVAFIGLPLAALGWWTLKKRSQAAAWASLCAFALCLIFGMNFPNPDLEAFYLLLYLLCVGWVGLGLGSLARRPVMMTAAACVVVGCAVAQAVVLFPAINQRKFTLPTDWVEDALAPMETGAVVLTREWDHYSPWLYLRTVKGVRPDITWIDTELLRRSWYPEFIRHIDSARYQAALPALERLAPQIAKFESGQPLDPEEIESAYADAIYALTLAQPGPVYVDGIAGTPNQWGVERVYLRGANEVPWGLTMRAFRAHEKVPFLPVWGPEHERVAGPNDGDRTRFHLELYRRMREANARYMPAN